MKVTFLLVLALQSPPADPWFSSDKIKHFFMAAFVQSVSYSVLRATDMGHRSSLIGASVGSTAVSIGKELSDQRRSGLFSTRDLVWDAAGIGGSTLLLERTRR